MSISHLIKGKLAEKYACHFLKKQGLKLLEKNYRCKQGEIDLIMELEDTLVFVEVRYRSNPHYGNSLDTVTPRKQQRLIKTAQYYLWTHHLVNTAARFDVVGLKDFQHPEWIQNAFEVQ